MSTPPPAEGAAAAALVATPPPARKQKKKKQMKGPWLVYIIQSTSSARTYVGCTNNFARRIRQHNGEITGGAKYTRGNSWAPVVTIEGFADDQRHALQFEWRLKERNRGGRGGRVKGRAANGGGGPLAGSGVDRRVASLHRTLGLEKVTAKAPPLQDTQISLQWHSSDAMRSFADLLSAQPLASAPLQMTAAEASAAAELLLQEGSEEEVPESMLEPAPEQPVELIDLVSPPSSPSPDGRDGNGNEDGDEGRSDKHHGD